MGVTEAALGRAPGLDVELAAPELRKGQFAKEPAAVLQQILVLQRTNPIDRCSVGRAPHESVKVRHRPGMREPAEGRVPVQRFHLDSRRALHHGRVAEPGKWPERIRFSITPACSRGDDEYGQHGQLHENRIHRTRHRASRCT